MQPSSLKILPCYPGTVLRRSEGTERANTACASMTGGGFVLNGLKEHPAHRMWRLSTTIRRNVMALIAIHPGEHLAEELKELCMSAAELARQLDVPTNRVTEILNGRRAITGDPALRLAHFFGTTAEFWLNLQSLFELRVAQKKAGKSITGLPTLKHLKRAHA